MKERIRVRKGSPNDERIQFYAKPEPGGCWLWNGYISEDGYGTVSVDGRVRKAHRVSYESYVGPIPEGLDIDHLCRVRNCVNPAHLEPVTRKENTHRGQTIAAKHLATTHCPQGHEYTPENIYSPKNGWRDCRLCRRRRSREWAQKKARERAGLQRTA